VVGSDVDDDAYAESDEDEDAEVEHDDVVDDNMVSMITLL
jgi:hypothetical protein